MKPLNWLSVKWVLFRCYVWKQSNMVHEKNPGLCMWFPSLAFSRHVKSWTLYICMGFDCGWCVRVSSHWPKNRSAFISKMIMRVCSLCHQWLCQSLSGGCNIIALLGWCDFVTVKGTVSANIVDTDNTGQFFCCYPCQLVSCILVKTLWLPVNNLHRRHWANESNS
jgi:hypothetical protein